MGCSSSRAHSGVKRSQPLPLNAMIASPEQSLVVQSNHVSGLIIGIRLAFLDDLA